MAMAFLFASAEQKIISQIRKGFGRNAKTLSKTVVKLECQPKKLPSPTGTLIFPFTV